MKKSIISQNQFQSMIQTNYDIIKGHGGEISVENEEGTKTEFINEIPIKNICLCLI